MRSINDVVHGGLLGETTLTNLIKLAFARISSWKIHMRHRLATFEVARGGGLFISERFLNKQKVLLAVEPVLPQLRLANRSERTLCRP